MNRFSIKDLENLTGVKAHTLRIWEQRYGILQPKRTATNIRYYDGDDLKTALRITLLNQYGYKISRIHQMTETDMDGLIQKIGDSDFKLQALVNKLLESALALNTVDFEQRLNDYIRRHGIENAVERLIFSFLEKVGTMWMTNRINPAQEHLASNVIVRKLAVAIDSLPFPATDIPAALLFLPEGEIHDMGLMYVHYLLRKSGHAVLYLGSNTPLKEAIGVCNLQQPAFAYIHLTAFTTETDLSRTIKNISAGMADITIYISGAMLQGRRLPAPGNVRYLKSLDEARTFCSSLALG